MKNIKNWLILLTLISVISCTKESKKEVEIANPTNDKAEISTALKALNEALINPKNATFENLVRDELSYGHSGGNIQNKEEFIDDLINGSFDFQEIKISNQTIDIVGQTGIVRNILSAKALNSGKPVEIRIGIFLIYQKENSKWKLLARQAYKL